MKRQRFLRLFAAALPALLVPVATACEAVLDFDRTPLQPVYEASVPSDGASGSEGGKSSSSSSSSGSSGSSASSSGGSSTSSSTSSTGGPVDAGADADSGSGS